LDTRELKKQPDKEEEVIYAFRLTALWLLNEVR